MDLGEQNPFAWWMVPIWAALVWPTARLFSVFGLQFKIYLGVPVPAWQLLMIVLINSLLLLALGGVVGAVVSRRTDSSRKVNL